MANTNRTFVELVAAVQSEMRMNPGLVSNAERQQFLNDGLSSIGSLTLLEKEATVSVLDGYITIPDDFVGMVSLTYNGVYLTPVRTDTPDNTGTPTGYVQNYANVRLVPRPLGTGTCVMQYAYRPQKMVADTDKPDILNGFDDLLVDYAVAKAYRKNGEIGLFREYMSNFEDGKSRMGSELIRRFNSRVTPSMSGATTESEPQLPADVLI